MSIISEIKRLHNNVINLRENTDAILEAITNKGVEVPSGSTLDDCPGLIGSISGGGGSAGSLIIDGKEYGVIEHQILYGPKISLITRDLQLKAGTPGIDYVQLGHRYYYHNRGNVDNIINAMLPDGYKVMTYDIAESIKDGLASWCGQYAFDGKGTNEYGGNFLQNGYLDYRQNEVINGQNSYIGTLGADVSNIHYFYDNGSNISGSRSSLSGDFYFPVRVFKEL